MLTAKKDGREVRAMVMKEPADRCLGVVQCALPGCEAYMAVVVTGTRRSSGNIERETPAQQIAWFHDLSTGRAVEVPVCPHHAKGWLG
jgi:hypothetical protein